LAGSRFRRSGAHLPNLAKSHVVVPDRAVRRSPKPGHASTETTQIYTLLADKIAEVRSGARDQRVMTRV
jgi:hypothetical protein